ncbi:TBC1 domain family member 20-like [Ornithodoros turicata]|uniref:TBC1 domain family member 20-like n=1 Tax=Ornithodoros turicata TaxID=34597 RepID=UPI00313890F5
MNVVDDSSELAEPMNGPADELKRMECKAFAGEGTQHAMNGMTGDVFPDHISRSLNEHSDGEESPQKQDDSVLNNFKARKFRAISRSLENGRTRELKSIAINELGLVSDGVRRLVWPKIGGVNVYETSPRPALEDIENHPYYQQVVLDVKRSLRRFPPSVAEAQRIALQDKLVFMIMRVLMKNPELHYYQGYHDICVTILLVLGEEVGFLLVEKLSRTNLSVFMEKTMAHTAELLEHVYQIFEHENPKLKSFLEAAGVGIMFCLSWVITWFGHVLSDYDTVVRLFDLFLASHSWMPIYLSAAIVMHKQEEILALDCDLAPVHSYLSRVVEEELPFEDLIIRAGELMAKHPPAKIRQERALRMEELRKKNVLERENKLRKCFRYVGALYRGRLGPYFVAATAIALLAVVFQVYRRHTGHIAAIEWW